jgi:hypothetical protein
MRYQFDITTWNVTSIVSAALVFGLAAGLPIGYIARQLYSSTPSSDVAVSQQD